MESAKITIRNYDKQIDRLRVEELEKRCEVGPVENSSLIADTMGDPLCRIRNSPMHNMLVAELDEELVGVVQGTIKIVTLQHHSKSQALTGYILGLRVSQLQRRKGIGLSLVKKMEEWFIINHVDFTYMATEKDNQASVNLFIHKLHYVKFRTPTILVNPVSHHPLRVAPSVKILKLKIDHAESLYRRFMSSIDFFPHDIDRTLKNKLSLGTWIAYWRTDSRKKPDFDECFPTSWAMVSVWNSAEIFNLRLSNPSLPCKLYTKTSTFIDRFFPCFGFPFLPDVSTAFGFYFMYGLYQQGPKSGSLMHTLCKMVHNMAAKCEKVQVVVAEVGGCDSLRPHIPHRKLLSCPEDLWCIKALKSEQQHRVSDLARAPHPKAIFIDPREV